MLQGNNVNVWLLIFCDKITFTARKEIVWYNYNVTRIFIGYRELSNMQLTCLTECYIPTPNALVCKQYSWPRYFLLWIWRHIIDVDNHSTAWQFMPWNFQVQWIISILMQYWIWKSILAYPLGLKITKFKIPRNIVERLWHINNVTSYETSSLKLKGQTSFGFVYSSILIEFNENKFSR